MAYKDDPIFNTLLVSGHALPGIWRYMLPAAFGELKLPGELLADCESCPMVAIGEYLPSCRCCTHLAQIPNFQLGLALKDPRTRDKALSVIEKGYALPTGIETTPKHLIYSTKAYADDLFGKSEALLCPFNDAATGGCTVYAFRTAICATHHCAHDHAAAGVEYWELLAQLIGQAETALSQWVLDEVGKGAPAYLERCDALADRLGELEGDDPRTWSKKTRQHLFGNWYGREAAFFMACANQVMARRDALWKIICDWHILEAPLYDAAEERLIQEAFPEKETLDSDASEAPLSISDLWDALQNATEQLWALPCNEEKVAVSDDVVITQNPRNDIVSKLYSDKAFRLTRQLDDDEDLESFLTRREREALALFDTPRPIDDLLLNRVELRALSSSKDFLAECLRAGILRVQQKL